MSLILDTYGDIFSSFDPREYAERSLSDDFLSECKKIVMDKWSEVVELRLMIPQAVRESSDEEIIKKRLHSYFLTYSHKQDKLYRKDISIGRWFVLWGILIWIIVSYILHTYAFAYFYTTMITVIGEPASWLLIWNGADKLLKYLRDEMPEQIFARRLARAKIQFYGY